MKKLLGWGFVVTVIIVAILSSLVSIAVKFNREEMAKRTSPTLSDLDALSERLREATPPPDLPEAPESEAARDESPSLPTRLASTPSVEMLEERFKEKRPDQIRGTKIEAWVFATLESTLRPVSRKQAAGWAWELGSEYMALGEWDAAKRCWWESLDAPLSPGIHRHACARLAWLEEDPEKAARLLELSCQEDEYGSWLSNAIRLSRVTGSTELADHYLARLRAENPKLAKYFDSKADQDAAKDGE